MSFPTSADYGLRQRLADLLRERRIARLCRRAQAAPQASLRRVLVEAMVREVNARSPGFLARAEARFVAGLSPAERRIFERAKQRPGAC